MLKAGILSVLGILVLAAGGWTIYSKVNCSGSCCSTPQLSQDKAKDPRKGFGIGTKAPEFELKKPDGTNISGKELQGKPAVLAFWSAYCSSCKKEAPKLNQISAEFASKGVRVIGVNLDTNDERMNEGVKSFGINYEFVRDLDTQTARAFKVVGTPTIIFLDKDGTIKYSGNNIPEDYAAQLSDFLKN